jgi:hypothetical protein
MTSKFATRWAAVSLDTLFASVPTTTGHTMVRYTSD